MTENALPPVTLEALLKKHGQWQGATTASGASVFINCFSPNHNDTTQSMVINRGTGTYHCNNCGVKGDALTYLINYRNLTRAKAEKVLATKHQWTVEKIEHADKQKAENERARAGLPKHYADLKPKTLNTALKAAEHHFTDARGKTIMVAVRMEKNGKRKIVHFTPRKDGGFWLSSPTNKALPKQDRADKLPVYALAKTLNNEHVIHVVDSEWAADIINGLNDGPYDGTPPPCVCLPTDIKTNTVDLSPLAGRQVIVHAAANNTSRNRARFVAKKLHEHGCAVRHALPNGDTNYDVSMAAAEGGWEGLAKWVKQHGNLKPWVTEQKQPQQAEQVDIDDDIIANNEHYRVLGLRDSMLLIQKKQTSEIVSLARSQLTSSANLLTVATLDFWTDLNNGAGLTMQNKERIASALIQASDRKGEIRGDHLFVGRGAFIDKRSGKVLFNTGSKLLGEDANGKLTREMSLSDSAHFAMPGAEITIVDNENAADYMVEMAETMLQYRWREKNDGLAFLGWIVSAVIGGALSFRTSVWLSAEKGKGKSFLLDKVLSELFTDMPMPIGNPTEASIADIAKSDSLPIILDEFEPGQSRLQQNGWNNILLSIRLASTGGATRTRASGGGKASIHRARFSAFISSIRRVEMTPATIDRIFPLYFSTESVDDWFALKDRILAAFHMDKCRAVISHIIRHAAILANEVDTLSRELATSRDMPTRLAEMCAALSVGARFFTGTTEVIVSHPEQHHESGQLELLRELLAATAYRDEGQEFSVADCLTAGYFSNGAWVGRQVNGVYSKESKIAASYGFGMKDDRTMLICANAPRMKKLLAGTKHENTDLAHYIRHLPRIEANSRRLSCAGQIIAARELPLSVYKHSGFNPTADDDIESVEL